MTMSVSRRDEDFDAFVDPVMTNIKYILETSTARLTASCPFQNVVPGIMHEASSATSQPSCTTLEPNILKSWIALSNE